jgi:hypothetical protein
VALLGKLLKNRHAGDEGLAWHAANLAGPETLTLSSPDFAADGPIPVAHAGKPAGGQELSPALAWTEAPAGTAQLLLVIQDPDAPTPKPYVHGVFLIEPTVTALGRGALDAKNPATGVQPLRNGSGRGYLGPAPIKGHGPHRYVFQLFALAKPVTAAGGTDLASAKPGAVVAAATVGDVLARGRVAGSYERP